MRQKVRKLIILFSFFIFPVTFYLFSPYLIIRGASERVLSGSGIVFLVMLIISLFFGRMFCGWVCPVGGMQDALIPVRGKRIPSAHWVKFLLFGPWLSIIIIMAVSSKGFSRADLFYSLKGGISIIQPYAWIIYYFVLGLVLILALSTGRRGFCHYSCWMAPFMMSGRAIRNLFKWPALRLVADPSRCTDCLSCTRHCPMSIDVNTRVHAGKMEHSDCVLCLECVDGCPTKTIGLSFKPGVGSIMRKQSR